MLNSFHQHISKVFLVMAAAMVLTACAELEKHADTIKPTAKLTASRLTAIDFDHADLEFDLAINNQNPIPLQLSGLDYDFKIDNQSLVSGVTAKGIDIAANSTSKVSLPVSISFDDLKKFAGDLADKDTLNYDLQTRFKLMLPIIGEYAIPVSKQGNFPVPKVPEIKLKKISLKDLNLTRANVIALVEIDNPNGFDLGLEKLNYQLKINNQNWGNGAVTQATKIASNSKANIEIPLSLDLLSIGTAAFSMLNSKSPLDYQLTGNAQLDTGLELLRNFDLPLNISGTTAIQ
jgi:LEA14-like dessication related protein